MNVMKTNRDTEFKQALQELAEKNISEPTAVYIYKNLSHFEPPEILDPPLGYASGQDKRRARRAKERAAKKK